MYDTTDMNSKMFKRKRRGGRKRERERERERASDEHILRTHIHIYYLRFCQCCNTAPPT